MRANKEYELCKAVSTYLKLQYPNVLFHFDLAGLNLSMAQAGMNKAIQKQKGFPDLFIMEVRNNFPEPDYYNGLFIELKAEGTKLYKRDGDFVSEHLFDQWLFMDKLSGKGYKCSFGIGFDECKMIIDNYLK